MTDSQLIDALLGDQRHHIEFNGHLTNHAKHAVIAPLARSISYAIKAWLRQLQLTPYGYGLETPKTSKYAIRRPTGRHSSGTQISFRPIVCPLTSASEKASTSS